MEILKTVLGTAAEAIWGYALDYIWGIVEMTCRFILYPFFAYALYKLSVREKLDKPILSIIPVYNMTYLTKIIKNLYIFGKNVGGKKLTVLLVICTILRNPLIERFPVVGDFLSSISVVFFFFYLLSLHRLWEMYMPKSADSLLILATLFPIIIPFLVFAARNRHQVSSQMLLDYNSDGIMDEVVTIYDAAQVTVDHTTLSKNILKQELSPVWVKDCPLIVNRQEIVTQDTSHIFLNITVQNLSNHTINAIFMDVLCFDYLQTPLQGITDHKLIDLSIKENDSYSTDMEIYLPDANTRKCRLVIKNIAFENNEIWSNTENAPLEPVNNPVKIQFSPELVKLMSERLKGRKIPQNQYLFQPLATEEYWFCGCGQFNPNSREQCHSCDIKREEIFEIINEDRLQADYSQMVLEREQHRKEAKERRQQMLLNQKQQIGEQFNRGKEKIGSLLKKK